MYMYILAKDRPDLDGFPVSRLFIWPLSHAMADRETSARDRKEECPECEVRGDTPSGHGPTVISQVTNVTKNKNVGQEVKVYGSHNTIIMTSGNGLHMMQQNSQCDSSSLGHTANLQPSHSPPPHHNTTQSFRNHSSRGIDVSRMDAPAVQISRVAYAEGEQECGMCH